MKFLIILFLGLSSCTKAPLFESSSWRQGDEISKVKFLNQISIEKPQTLQIQDENQEFSRQTHQGFPVAKSFVKKISASSGQWISVAANYKSDLPILTPDELNLFSNSEKAKSDLLKIHQKRIPEFVEFSAVWNQQQILVWEGVFFEKTGQATRVQFDSNLRFLGQTPTGSHFTDRSATVFPLGPKISQLQEVAMPNLKLDSHLGTDFFKISSLKPLSFDLSQMQFNFSPEDHHFDPLQVFYYVDRVQKWTQEKLNIDLKIPLNIQLATGYPEQTNAAFYYNGQIRLGTGDGTTYKHIPQDASIVMHEVFHSLIESISQLPHEGEGGSINEAYADYLTTQVLGRPHLAESAYLLGPYKRSLIDFKKWNQKSGALYGDSLIISGLLWQLTQELPTEKIHQVAIKTLSRLNPMSQFHDFNFELRSVLKEKLTDQEHSVALAILTQREFPDDVQQ